jgi:DNA-binding MarR family transcriptional regulator/ribosomal protein S18 acetylase RimI-like enzyme
MPTSTDDLVGTVRDFNRFYTNVIGALRGGLLDTPYTLTEARVIFELAQRDAVEVTDLRRELDIDSGYLSRILSRFAADGLIDRERSGADARRQVIRLTTSGREAYRMLDERSAGEIRALLDRLGGEQRQRLAGAMSTIREVLGAAPRPRAYLIRPPRPGDMGWVVARNGALYAREFGWDETYEALVARIVADFVADRDPRREAAWIAELDGAAVGCVFCVTWRPAGHAPAPGPGPGGAPVPGPGPGGAPVPGPDPGGAPVPGPDPAVAPVTGSAAPPGAPGRPGDTAQLRLLLVDPAARGLGIGGRLVAECLAFARQAGYRRIMLWTNDVLADARRIYQRAGFALATEERHHSFGHDLVGQVWWRDL